MTNGDSVECSGCEFVYMPENEQSPVPRNHEMCPNCDGTTFQFLDSS